MSSTIGKISLKNMGGFAVKLQFVYWDAQGAKHHQDGTGAFDLEQSQSADPGDYGVPDGTEVSLYAFVVWGSDQIAPQMLTYKKGSTVTASYTISGTTLSSDIVLNGIA